MHADPASEIPAVTVALDATIEAESPQGRRSVPAGEFFEGTWDTVLADDELLTGVRLPVWEGRCGFAVEEVARRHGDFAIDGACVAVEVDGDSLARCSIGLFGLGSTPQRAHGAERLATGVSVGDLSGRELGRAAIDDLGTIPSDLNGSADYRAQIGAVVVARALDRAVEEACDG